MGVTTNYALPYPELSDTPNVPLDMQKALTAVDTKFASVDSAIATSAYTAPTLANASLYSNVQQNVPTAVWTDINLQVEQVDNLNGHSADSLPQKYKVPQGGQYMVTASGGLDTTSNGGGMCAIAIRLLKANDNLYHYIAYQSGTPVLRLIEWLGCASFIGPLNAGDMLSVAFWQSGINTTIKTTDGDNYPVRLGVHQFL